MPKQSKLLDINPQLGILNDLYQDTANFFRETKLSNYLQVAAAEVFEKSADISLFSIDIENALNTDELRNEFNANRYNYLQLVNFEGLTNILDLNQDLGGVAHYIASKVSHVDSIKIDVDRARIASQRCTDFSNISHISEDLEKLDFPEKHYDLVLIGDLAELGLSNTDLSDLLSKLNSALSSNGIMIVGSANRNRVSKWLDLHNFDNPNPVLSAAPYADLYQNHAEQEVSRRELQAILQSSGFDSQATFASYAKDASINNLFSESYLVSHPNALNHFYRIGSIENQQINEYLLFRKLQQDNAESGLLDSASRYLVFAGTNKNDLTGLFNVDFVHFPGNSRKPKWRAITHCLLGSEEVTEVTKAAQYDELKIHESKQD